MSATPWEKLPALPGHRNPCGCCPPIGSRFHPESVIAVGFGSATLERDGVVVIDGEQSYGKDGIGVTGADAEALAARDPDHAWRIVLFGPLHGETYQRHGPGEWMLVEKNEGFA